MFKKKGKGFFSRSLKNMFGSWQKLKNIGGNSLNNPCGKYSLKIPVVMVVEIRRPKEMGLSKKVWFCKGLCNTVYTYYGDNQIHDEDFAGGFPEDVTKVLTTSGLLSSEHWEKEYVPNTSDGKRCLSVNITFHYDDGTKFERFNSGIFGTSRLLSAAENILNCESVAHVIFQDDIKLLERSQDR